jgi:tRNA threonylcarbamoyladenosine biosynthesis protein TsaB
MTLLALDTSGDYGVLALADVASGGTLRACKVFEGRRTLSRRLLSEVDGLLEGEGMTLGDVSAFGVGLGPGSFTGVRVGVTTAKTLAQVTGRPLVGVPTLDAYAWGWAPDAPTRVVVLPSRRGEVYAAVYRPDAPPAEPFAAPYAVLERLLEGLSTEAPVICCGAVELLTWCSVPSLSLSHVPPAGLSRLAAQRLGEGHAEDPLALTPLYVVPPAISLPKIGSA